MRSLCSTAACAKLETRAVTKGPRLFSNGKITKTYVAKKVAKT